jgi:hypothetical protein
VLSVTIPVCRYKKRKDSKARGLSCCQVRYARNAIRKQIFNLSMVLFTMYLYLYGRAFSVESVHFFTYVCCNVVDPYVFGPPGSGSVIICPDPDPSIIKQKSTSVL